MTGTVQIRPVDEDEREAWNPLWAAYLAFYKTALTQDVSDLAWMRFHDPDEPMFALGGYIDGKLVGFAHYLFHRSTWAPHRYCYLEDLFVAETARGRGVGRARQRAASMLTCVRHSNRPTAAPMAGCSTRWSSV